MLSPVSPPEHCQIEVLVGTQHTPHRLQNNFPPSTRAHRSVGAVIQHVWETCLPVKMAKKVHTAWF